MVNRSLSRLKDRVYTPFRSFDELNNVLWGQLHLSLIAMAKDKEGT